MTDLLSETEHVDTGLNPVTVTVTQAVPALPLAAAPAPLPAGFTIPAAAALARDLAINMYPEEIILRKHGVTTDQLNTLNDNNFFQKLLEAAAAEWNSAKSMPQRLALEAQVLIEDAMPAIGGRMRNATEPLPGVVQALAAITKVAGIGENKAPQAAGEKFTITINLGADTLKYEKSRQIEGSLSVRSQSEGDGDTLALSSFNSP